MHFARVIQSRKGRAWAVLIALAIKGILIAAFVLVSWQITRTVWFGRTQWPLGL